MIQPNYLQKNDTVAIVSTARKISLEEIQPAIDILQSWGLKVIVGQTIGIEDNQFAAIAFRSGILVNVPAPARFAVHKLVVSRRRPSAQQVKARKDIQQATELFNILIEDRPGDIWIALDAASTMPRKFQSHLKEGINLLPDDTRQALQTHYSSIQQSVE